jgi:TPR repeat protein
MTIDGIGVARDTMEALRWFTKAAQGGHLSAMAKTAFLLDGILESGDPPEPPQVFAPTLLRLGLLAP